MGPRRINRIKEYTNGIIMRIYPLNKRANAFIHTYGVAECCALIAGKRGLDPELSYISGLLHDIYSCYTGSDMCHAQSGADMARVAINKMDIFSNEEKIIILSAIFNHSSKNFVHDDYDEVLKDADVLQRHLSDACIRPVYASERRLKKTLGELGISAACAEGEQRHEDAPKAFTKAEMADTAEAIASKNVSGDKNDGDYMEIIKYYPEDSAVDELKNGWCAAFVYHCALKAGLELPIRQPPVENRFAGAGPWYEWGKLNGFCFWEKDGFIPARGDVLVYNNIIPPSNKPNDSPWHDHIGVVLSCDKEHIIVAEGNVNNENTSGIVERKRDAAIGCYIRIPDNYVYDGWNCDYKAYVKRLL